MKQFLIIILLFFISAVGGNDNNANARDIKHGWFWVIDSLQANGINPNTVPWAAVNQSCMWAPLESDSFANCQYEKVMDREQHIIDRDQCAAEAITAFPESLTEPATIYAPPYFWRRNINYNYSEIKIARNGYIRRCMSELGWRNSDNYLMGKREDRARRVSDEFPD